LWLRSLPVELVASLSGPSPTSPWPPFVSPINNLTVHLFAFPAILCMWNQKGLLFCGNGFFCSSQLFSDSLICTVHSFLLLRNVRCVEEPVYHLQVDIWVISRLGLLHRKVKWTFRYKSLCGYICLFSWVNT
jgi:hypothetical protein